ncbi:hypothetical protein KCP76_15540 [Salmonella enterica subsp. enterica serovar Weltevreden]|nr:hypothetical protein KCP76_15540 [Salmonella enterica subsp. enterica serovar Weltevreden]
MLLLLAGVRYCSGLLAPPQDFALTDAPDALSSLAKARVFIDGRRLSITFARLISSLNSG